MLLPGMVFSQNVNLNMSAQSLKYSNNVYCSEEKDQIPIRANKLLVQVL
jgi:hypothetical protein